MTDSPAIDIEGIIARLPHRFPFLMVDRVLEIKAGESIVALKNVSINEAHFAGHFPQYAVMPGVLVVEALAQAGGVLAWESARAEEHNVTILLLAGIEEVRFKRPVRPGDQLILKANLIRHKRGVWRSECLAEVDDQLVCAAKIVMVTRKDP
jgi:3-hydroxyacyl-[acyl-carrier-protein] dehydratase